MPEQSIDALNERFAVPGHLAFAAHPSGIAAHIRNAHATASVALYGAQPLTFQPHGAPPLLWLSEQAVYAPGKAIRGGIPLCWPWFGPHPSDLSLPAHGFVRTRVWQVLSASGAPGGATALRLGLTDDDASRALWPHPFELELALLVGGALQLELLVRNTGEAPLSFSGALHSYFTVGDVAQIAVGGLDGAEYLDQTDAMRRVRQSGPVRFAGEVDRIYLDTEAECAVEDPSLGRTIRVAKSGSRSTVVWNPWAEKARRLADMADDAYRGMVCVETANAAEDAVTLAPGAEHRLLVRIAATPLA